MIIGGYKVKLGYDKYQDALELKPLDAAILELKAKENYTEYENIPDIYFQAL